MSAEKASSAALDACGACRRGQHGVCLAGPYLTCECSCSDPVHLCSQCGEGQSIMRKIGTGDGWCLACLDQAALSDARHATNRLVMAVLDLHDHADTCDVALSLHTDSPCSCWKADLSTLISEGGA